MPSYFAHSANSSGQWHDLPQHLSDVAKQARVFAAKFGAGEFGYWAGLWHDLGKFVQEFQAYLEGRERKGPDHSTAGAIHAFSLFDQLARLVAGHHCGLPNDTDLERRVKDKKKKKLADAALERARATLVNLSPVEDLWESLPEFVRSGSSEEDHKRSCELFFRLVFSALTDADFLDTEKHFNAAKHALRFNSPKLKDLWTLFEKDQNALSGKAANRLQEIRHEIYRRCLEKAQLHPGIFTLTVPTGGGKTRSGLAFAMRHAMKWEMDRVIVAIPYTSIIEQTAGVYRDIFKQMGRYVLEHHSAVPARKDEDTDPVTFDEVWSRLASENWDAPIVVTTTVQLFESLFANRPNKCRKLHNIANSVVILDEVQTLPVHLLKPILDVLQQLADNYRVSVVLCTATQPALKSHASFRGLKAVKPIIDNPEGYFGELKRVEYESHIGEPWEWARVAQEIRTSEQALAVVNTKKDAFALLDALEAGPNLFHLSTQMCGAHRFDVLQEVKRRLEPTVKEPCLLVSTQVVESGVDLDFPLVLRAVGPLDRIVQAAGRCNREGRLAKDGVLIRGRVVIFEPAEGRVPPGMYETAMDEAKSMLRRKCNLDRPQTFEEYFGKLFGTIGSYLDKEDIQGKRALFDYPQVARDFRMIDDDTVPVIVRPKWGDHPAKVARLLELLRSKDDLPQWIFRELQPYVVGIRRWAIPRCQEGYFVREIVPGREIWEWMGRYDRVRGLVEAPLPPDELVCGGD
jgi:CRISPR-associated endonuclease/helicase Cas3